MEIQELTDIISDFFNTQTPTIEIYNEFSLQQELGIFLRNELKRLYPLTNYKVQFERNISFFNCPTPKHRNWVKKEIDIVVYNENISTEKFAIELKFPQNKAYPKRMYQFIIDICFIEQLKQSGFKGGCTVTLVNDSNFYKGNASTGIYGYFRMNSNGTIIQQISGIISNPIHSTQNSKKKNLQKVIISGNYSVKWIDTVIQNRSNIKNGIKTNSHTKYYIIPIF